MHIHTQYMITKIHAYAIQFEQCFTAPRESATRLLGPAGPGKMSFAVK